MKGYIGRHWRGEQHVVWATLVAMTAVVAGGGIAFALGPVALNKVTVFLAAAVELVVAGWAGVGAARSAYRTLNGPEGHWALKLFAVAVLILGVMVLVGVLIDLWIVMSFMLV